MLSIVTSVYRSETYLQEFYDRCRSAMEAMGLNEYEFVFVIDGQTDDSISKLLELKQRDSAIRVIELSRNFGHHKAMLTGILQSKGDQIFILDCDLEESPELLVDFSREMKSSQADVVYGVQSKRKGKWGERMAGHVFYRLFNALADVPIQPNILMARLMTRRYVDSLSQYEERSLFLGGVFAMVGYEQVAIEVSKGSRGETNYSIRKRLSLMVDAITASTHRLLEYVFYLGIFISSFSFIASIYYLVSALFLNEYLGGWPSLILSIWFLSGMIILSIGVLGMYISKMFVEVKRRPLTVIKREL